MAQFNTTELDFDAIKENIKNYFLSSDSEFSDWDFEGSGLNTLLDVLAYNTHYNAMLAHMSMNESFLDSAQVRGNVVSRAKLLGYTPRSISAATAEVTFVVNGQSSPYDPTFVVPNYTKFKSVVNGETYTFLTRNDSDSASISNESYTFENLELTQGTLKTVTYYVDNSYDQHFLIKDENADTSTLIVRVYSNYNRDEESIYELFTDFVGQGGSESLIYFLDENMDGYYEVRFGNDVFGKAPPATALIELEYISTDGEVANGATDFEFVEWGDTVVNVEPGTVTTTSNARSGSIRESISSIKYNAPLNFIAQKRAVTASDYYALITENITGIDSVVVWGGEDNEDEQLGYVYICPKPSGSDLYLTSAEEDAITEFLADKGIVGMKHEIVRPEYTYLYFEIEYKYNPSLTSKSSATLSNQMIDIVQGYNDDVLRTFDGVFRHSNFICMLDDSDRAVLNTTARIHAYKEWQLSDTLVGDPSPENYTVDLSFGFKLDGTIDQSTGIITNSPTYESSGNTYTIVDKAQDQAASPSMYTSAQRPLFIESTDPSPNVSIEVGYINIETGDLHMDLTGYEPDASPDPTIEIHIVPRSNDVAAKRAKILKIDSTYNTYYGEVDTAFTGSGNTNYTTFDRE